MNLFMRDMKNCHVDHGLTLDDWCAVAGVLALILFIGALAGLTA